MDTVTTPPLYTHQRLALEADTLGYPLTDHTNLSAVRAPQYHTTQDDDFLWGSAESSGLTPYYDPGAMVTGGLNALNLLNLSLGENVTETDGGMETTAAELVRDVTLGVVLAIMCLATTFGNAMVLHAVRTDRRLQTVSFTNYYTYRLLALTLIM